MDKKTPMFWLVPALIKQKEVLGGKLPFEEMTPEKEEFSRGIKLGFDQAITLTITWMEKEGYLIKPE